MHRTVLIGVLRRNYPAGRPMGYEQATQAALRYSQPAVPLFRRSQQISATPRPDEVIWGVARREGFGDADDPEQHSGVTQHAFRLGQDNRAVCGYEPPRRRAAIGQVLPQLAVAGPANPRCPRCEALLTGQPAGDPADPLARLPGTALTQTTKRRR